MTNTDSKVVIVGGGIVGASLLYSLSKRGWNDCLLVERGELTCGSTWHAAGNTTHFGPYAQMTKLFAGSLQLYQQAEQDSGQSIGFHQTGSLRVATTARERELFLQYESNYRELDIPYRVVGNDVVSDLNPAIDTNGLFGAAHTPADGHVDPTSTTHALAKAAQNSGAEIIRHTPVLSINQDGNHWLLETKNGDIRTEYVVVAASFWTRELLIPLGINTPLYATEHHEFITDEIDLLKGLDQEVPAMRDSYVSCSVRQEQNGFLAGIYETLPEFWKLDGIPVDFGPELLAPNTERLMPHFEKLMQRMPVFEQVGIKTINNGPMCWTPDGLPMLGPLEAYPGLWLASGFNVGIGTGGGSTEYLADWMTNGTPPYALPIVHADRFGNDVSVTQATESIKACYRQGYKLPDTIG